MTQKKHRKRPAKVMDTHEDGPVIPPLLLGELRATKKRYDAAILAVQQHNEQGKSIDREAVNAEAVYRHFVERVATRFKLQPDDMLDLTRGVVRLKTRHPEGVQ